MRRAFRFAVCIISGAFIAVLALPAAILFVLLYGAASVIGRMIC